MQNDNHFIKKINDGERDAMEQDISITECHKALKTWIMVEVRGLTDIQRNSISSFGQILNTLLFHHLPIHVLTNDCPFVSDKALLHVFLKKVKIKVY